MSVGGGGWVTTRSLSQSGGALDLHIHVGLVIFYQYTHLKNKKDQIIMINK